MSIDHESGASVVPIVQLDLTSPGGEAILWDMLESQQLLGVHLGLPCGTASRARERPVAPHLQKQGVPNPPPLRSADHPLGLPNLSAFHQAKVDSANRLYALAVAIMVFCWRRDIIFSIENPANSWLWAALVQLTLQHSTEAAEIYNRLEKVVFHACCHGSTRRKETGWLATKGVYDSLQAVCQYDHPHDAWGVKWNNGSWAFDTSLEAAYPTLLAQRVASCLARVAKQRGYTLGTPQRLHDLSTAMQGKQSKRHPALISEFHHFEQHDASSQVPEGAKLLPPHSGGDVIREEQESSDTKKKVKVGFYHTPEQFLQKALQTGHPMDTTEHLEEVTREALEFNLRYPHHLVELERKKNLLHARLMAAQLEKQEMTLHEEMPECPRKVLDGKRLLLWRCLLEKYGYDDMGIFEYMAQGVPLAGKHSTAPCYPGKVKPASITVADLEASATWRRKAMLGRKNVASEASHIEHLESTAAEELEHGFLEGPFGSEREVSDFFGHDQWMLIRRFVLVQGAEMKLRPIDDCLESQLNQAYTSTSYLKLQDIDFITGLALRVAEAVAGGRQRHGSGAWKGKCLDLSKAYKQMAIRPDHRHLAVLFFHGRDGSPKFYVANSLMFGATAAVYSFNRVSRSLWFLFNRMLKIPSGVFYDDFPLFSPSELAENADSSASELLDLLGWRHARTGPKGLPFESQFQVLGCSLDFSRVPQGLVTAENKPGRIDRLLENLDRIKTAGRMSLHEAQILHGLLRYATGFFAGKHLHQVCAEVMALGSGAANRRLRDLTDFCDYATSALNSSKPRVLSAFSERRPVLIFTDGAWENQIAGIGAAVIDLATKQRWVLAGRVPQVLLDRWQNLVGDQLICQVELYVMVAVRWLFRDLLKERRSLWWVDNDATRFAIIKGLSSSPAMRSLVREFYAFEIESPSFTWVERVPSFSNVADGPSRGKPQEALSLLGVNECKEFQHCPELVQRLLADQLVNQMG